MIRIIASVAMIFWAAAAHAQAEIQQVKSPDGIKAWLVEEPSIPFTALEIMFKGGAALDPADKRGVANLMTGLLEEGAGELNAQEFAAAQERLAASFGFRVYDDTLTVSVRFLTENRAEVLALLKSVLMTPRFDVDAIERVRAQVLSGIGSEANDPDSVAGAKWYDLAFGEHPYGSDLSGSLESVATITRSDLVGAHAALLVRDNLFVSAVGDVTATDLGFILDDLLGDLPMGDGRATPPASFATKGGLTVVDMPTPQSVALFGHVGIDRNHPDFFAAYILNTILGGRGVESRLTAEVREKRGLTYGVSTFLVSKEQAHMVMGQVASANDRIAEAIDVIRAEWVKMAHEGVTAKELQDAKTYLTGAYPLRFDGNAKIADILVGMQRQGLAVGYIATRNDRVNAVTLAEINRVASELLRPDDLHFVVVGQPEGLNQQ